MGPPPSRQPPSRWQLPANPKLVIGCLIGVVALSASAVMVSLQADPPPPASALTVPPPGVAAVGRLEPQGEVVAVSAPASTGGAKVERLFVALGDQLREGQTIATLDNHEKALRGLELARQQWRVAEMRVRQVEAGAKTGEIQAQRSRVQQLRRELEGQIASQSLAIQRLGYELRNAKTECQRHSRLFSAGAISASQRDSICLVADTTSQQKLEAEAQLQRTQHTLMQQINEAASNQTAVAEVRPIDVALAKAEAQEAEARVKQAAADLALSTVRSPRNGQVLRVLTKGGERVSDKGIIELGNTRQMSVMAEVYETDISRVRVGQTATIIAPGIEKKLIGVVRDVGLTVGKKDVLGTDPAAASDARVLEVRIDLSPESSPIVKGMTNLQVDVLIHTDQTKP